MKRALEQGSEPPRRKRRLGHGPMRDPRLRVAVFVHHNIDSIHVQNIEQRRQAAGFGGEERDGQWSGHN